MEPGCTIPLDVDVFTSQEALQTAHVGILRLHHVGLMDH